MTDAAPLVANMDALSRDELETMLRQVRTLAWVAYADGRTADDYRAALHAILCATKEVGNDPA